ncbi:MAG TPA: glycosyltransferase family 2 protein [Allosphingosinicella sp.]|jgi:succinoglycan biosynthesis protein ExoO|nr:glycosyltransferase family 2 protein [Allosphingosinicella sp.]
MSVADQPVPERAPTVSVLIPAYNVADYLEEAVASALAQEVDLEVVVVDDGSTDATPETVRRLEADPRVRGFRLPVNAGPSAARNKALDEARGEWIAFLDADDWFAPGRLAYLLKVAEAAGAEAVTDDLLLINEGADKPWTTIYEITGWTQSEEGRPLTAAELCRHDWIIQPMFRRAWLQAHGLRFHTIRNWAGEDFEFYMNAMLLGVKWVTARDACYYYRSRPGQLTGLRTIAAGIIESLEAMARDERVRADPELARAMSDRIGRVRSAQWVGLLADAVRGGRWLRAAAMVLRSPARIADAAAALRRRMDVRRRWKEAGA